MDSEHRHELHSNEMVKFIKNLPEYVNKYSWQIIGVCLIIAAIVFSGPVKGYFAKHKMAEFAQTTSDIRKVDEGKVAAIKGQMAGADAPESSLLIAANKLVITAQETSSDALAATALLKRAEALRADLHYSGSDAEASVVKGQIEKAKAVYEQALARAKGNLSLSAKAEYGLGLCAEEVGDYAGAEAIYNKIVDNADYAVTVFPAQAKARLEKMADNQVEFVFADAPAVIEQVQGEPVTGTINVIEPEASKPAENAEKIVIEPVESKPVEE